MYGLNDVELEYDEEDFETLTTYKIFCQHIRPLICKENPKTAQSKIVSLVGAKWREFLAQHPNKDLLEKPARKGRSSEGQGLSTLSVLSHCLQRAYMLE